MDTATGMHPLSQNVVWEEGVTSVSGEIPFLLQYDLLLYVSVYTFFFFTVVRTAGISETVLSLWHNDNHVLRSLMRCFDICLALPGEKV